MIRLKGNRAGFTTLLLIEQFLIGTVEIAEITSSQATENFTVS